jgi:hypothetical protein
MNRTVTTTGLSLSDSTGRTVDLPGPAVVIVTNPPGMLAHYRRGIAAMPAITASVATQAAAEIRAKLAEIGRDPVWAGSTVGKSMPIPIRSFTIRSFTISTPDRHPYCPDGWRDATREDARATGPVRRE